MTLRKWMIAAFCIVASLIVTRPAQAVEHPAPPVFDAREMLDPVGSIWSVGADYFITQFPKARYRWVSLNARKWAKTYGSAMTCFGQPVVEALAQFKDSQLKELTYVLYSRGDTGDITPEDFQKTISEAKNELARWIEASPRRIEIPSPAAGVEIAALVWKRPPYQVKLEWSYSTGVRAQGAKTLPEYVRVFVSSSDSDENYASSIMAKKARQGNLTSRSALKATVHKEYNGDVWIRGIPMVDQGQKGYCAVASTERLMRHYGHDVDQHQFAQLAQSSASRGTNPEVMIDVLRKMSVDMNCKTKTIIDFDYRDLVRTMEKYNRGARKAGLQELPIEDTLNPGQIYHDMDTAILKQVRGARETEYHNFIRTIQTYVDRGTPLMWSVFVGKVTEEPPINGFGGHMRLVIGYNTKTSELIYSDSWGPGHERKRMSFEDAWMITTMLIVVEPDRMSA